MLQNCTDHPTAETVYKRVKEQIPSISLGTVYRNLSVLADEGSLITIESRNRSVHYDGNTAPHRHFICSRCGQVTDLFFPITTPPEIAAMGYEVQTETCVYYGLCRDCKMTFNQ